MSMIIEEIQNTDDVKFPTAFISVRMNSRMAAARMPNNPQLRPKLSIFIINKYLFIYLLRPANSFDVLQDLPIY